MTHAAQMGLQLSDALVLWCVQDHREFGKILLGLHWIFHLLNKNQAKQKYEAISFI